MESPREIKRPDISFRSPVPKYSPLNFKTPLGYSNVPYFLVVLNTLPYLGTTVQYVSHSLTFMFEDFHFTEPKVLFVLPVIPDVDKLSGMTLVVIAIEQGFLILEEKKRKGNERQEEERERAIRADLYGPGNEVFHGTHIVHTHAVCTRVVSRDIGI